MKILVVVDEKPYCLPAVEEAVKLALNTWADVTLLGLLPKGNGAKKPSGYLHRLPEGDLALGAALEEYKNTFLRQGQDGKHPYSQRYETSQWVEVRPDVWQVLRVVRGQLRDVSVRVRRGAAAGQILAEETEEEYDLIILASDGRGDNVAGLGAGDLQKVIDNCPCSVMVVKGATDIKRIVCCLDQSEITQESLELINQLVTIHGASLELLGVTRGEGWIKFPVDDKLANLWTYYHERLQNQVYSGFKPLDELERFATQDARPDLLALWHGQTSILKSVFSKGWLAEFTEKSQSSVLLLR